MIWLYEKDSEALRLETRYDNERGQYVLNIHRADGTEVERYDKLEDFRQRLLGLEKTLATEQWARAAAPIIDPTGWPNSRPS